MNKFNSIKSIFIFIFFTTALLLVGCAGMGWSKPGSSQADFYNDKNDCDRQAAQTFPVAMGSTGSGYQAPTTTNCTRVGNNVDCTSFPGAYSAPQQQDMNAMPRLNYVTSCLKSKGYSWAWSR